MISIIRNYLTWVDTWREKSDGAMSFLTCNQAGTCSHFQSGSLGPLRATISPYVQLCRLCTAPELVSKGMPFTS